jgi:hypothetical protein
MKLDRQTKEQNESLYLKEIKLRESKIEELNQQVRLENNNRKNIFIVIFSLRNKTKLFSHLNKKFKVFVKRSDTILLLYTNQYRA